MLPNAISPTYLQGRGEGGVGCLQDIASTMFPIGADILACDVPCHMAVSVCQPLAAEGTHSV